MCLLNGSLRFLLFFSFPKLRFRRSPSSFFVSFGFTEALHRFFVSFGSAEAILHFSFFI